MAVYDSGEAAAQFSESFQQTDDKDTRGRRVFGACQEYFLFLDHVEAVRMFTVSALSQACRPVSVARVRCLFELRLNNPLYFLGEPTTPLGLSGEP